MLNLVASIFSLFVGTGALVVGVGLLGTLLGLRGAIAGFPQWVLGLLMGAYFLGYVFGSFAWPSVIRRVGHSRAFAAMAALASASAVLHALFVEPVAWAMLRLLTGFCVVGIYLVIETWLNTLAPTPQRGRLFAAYTALVLVSLAGGQWLITLGGIQGFTLFGIASILFSLAVVPVALTRVPVPQPVSAPPLGLPGLYRTAPIAWYGALAAGLVNGAFWGMAPVFAHGAGLNDIALARFMAFTVLGGVALQWPLGYLSDRVDRRKLLVGLFAAGSLLAVLIGAIAARRAAGLHVAGFLYGGCVFSLYALSVAHAADRSSAEDRPSANGALLLLFGAGAVGGPVLAGLLMSVFGPLALAAHFAAVLGSAGAIALFHTRRSAPTPAAERSPFVPMQRTSQAPLVLEPTPDGPPAGSVPPAHEAESR